MKTLTRTDAGTREAKQRDARDLTPTENADLCSGCVKCCTYITVEVDAPRSSWEYDQWIWALHHEHISMYVERPEKWFLQVETRCRRLGQEGRCTIYGRHPVLCREYDPRTCERRFPLSDIRAAFHDAHELEDWLKVNRPRHWEKLMAHRRDFTPPPANGNGARNGAHVAAALVQIAAGAAAATKGAKRR